MISYSTVKKLNKLNFKVCKIKDNTAKIKNLKLF